MTCRLRGSPQIISVGSLLHLCKWRTMVVMSLRLICCCSPFLSIYLDYFFALLRGPKFQKPPPRAPLTWTRPPLVSLSILTSCSWQVSHFKLNGWLRVARTGNETSLRYCKRDYRLGEHAHKSENRVTPWPVDCSQIAGVESTNRMIRSSRYSHSWTVLLLFAFLVDSIGPFFPLVFPTL